jgi:hypothetical protein
VLLAWPRRTARPQCRLNRLLTSRPEMISANDNLVSGTVVAATVRVLANVGCLSATLGPCRLMTFRLRLSTSTTVGGGATDAYDCSGDGALGTASATSTGGGTIVGWLVSMTTRSGGCCMEAIRMTGLLLASGAGSGEDLGRHQSATKSNARSDAPTQAISSDRHNRLSPL